MYIEAVIIVIAAIVGIVAVAAASYKMGRLSGYEEGLGDALEIVEGSYKRVTESHREYRNV